MTIKRHIPNAITMLRIGTTAVIPFVRRTNKWLGFALFVLAAGTDKLDGYLAKNVYGVTDLGKVLDPVADKLLTSVALGTLIAEAKRESKPRDLALLVGAANMLAIREVVVLVVKTRAHQRTGAVRSSIQSGRISMVAQSAALAAQLLPIDRPAAVWAKRALLGAGVAASFISGTEYVVRYEIRQE